MAHLISFSTSVNQTCFLRAFRTSIYKMKLNFTHVKLTFSLFFMQQCKLICQGEQRTDRLQVMQWPESSYWSIGEIDGQQLITNSINLQGSAYFSFINGLIKNSINLLICLTEQLLFFDVAYALICGPLASDCDYMCDSYRVSWASPSKSNSMSLVVTTKRSYSYIQAT